MLNIKVGMIPSSSINYPNVVAVKSAVYLSPGEREVAFGIGDVITMRLDLDELKIEWLVNS